MEGGSHEEMIRVNKIKWSGDAYSDPRPWICHNTDCFE